MSISSLHSNHAANHWARPAAPRPDNHPRWSTASKGGSGSPVQAGAGSPAAAPSALDSASAASTNPLRNLASDIQAMLIQAQGTAAAAHKPTTPAAGGGPSATGPEQKLATDIQTLLSDLQIAATPNPRTANANPADTAGRPERHHHHHHERGIEATGASAVASSNGANPLNNGNHAVSRIFAAEIAHALKAYGRATGITATPAPVT